MAFPSRSQRQNTERWILRRLPIKATPSDDQARAWSRGICHDDEKAVIALYWGYAGLVVRVACSLMRNRHELPFLLECGAGCLMNAIAAYAASHEDGVDRGMPFASHAFRHVYFGIRQAQAAWDDTHPPPTSRQQHEMDRVEERLRAGEIPFGSNIVELLAQSMDTWPGAIRKILKASWDVVPQEEAIEHAYHWKRVPATEYDDPVERLGGPQDLEASFHDPRPLPYEAAVAYERRVVVQALLATLTPLEEKIIRMRFGIGHPSDLTLEEVGQEFEVTRERIRQIEAKALRKLRHPRRSKYLRSFVEGS